MIYEVWISGVQSFAPRLVVLDDDVFVNLERLYRLLQRHPSPDHPVAFAHVLSSTEVETAIDGRRSSRSRLASPMMNISL